MPIHTDRLRAGDTVIVIGDDVRPGDTWLVFSVTGIAFPPDNPGADPKNLNYFKGHTLLGRLVDGPGSTRINASFELPKMIEVGADMSSLDRQANGRIRQLLLNGIFAS